MIIPQIISKDYLKKKSSSADILLELETEII